MISSAKPTAGGAPMPNDNPTGEEVTGFINGAGRGEFNCGNCVHMKGSACTHPVMVSKSHLLRDKDGNPKVDSDDCCKFQRRKGDN